MSKYLSLLNQLVHVICHLNAISFFPYYREAMGVVLHKDSKWFQQWKDFKDNNAVFNSKNKSLN